jgi:hypothetical protein
MIVSIFYVNLIRLDDGFCVWGKDKGMLKDGS